MAVILRLPRMFGSKSDDPRKQPSDKDKMSTASLPPEAHAAIAQVRQQIGEEQQLKHRQQIAEHCFKKCIATKGMSLSGTRLDSAEQTCLAMCRDRYADTLKVVQQSLVDRQHNQSHLQ